MQRLLLVLLTLGLLAGCAPKEPVVLREVHIKAVEMARDGKNAMLKADAILYNPNKGSMRLKEIDMDIFIDDKKSARIDQQLTAQIKAVSEFTVPLEVQLNLSDAGLLDTIFSLFGKKHKIRFAGKLRVKVKGFPVSIPIDHTDEIKF